MQHQTYLQDCNCERSGIIINGGKAVCRWCRKPYAKGGCMLYMEEHFKPLDYEIISYKREWNDNIHSAKDLENIKHDYPIYSVRRLSDGEIFTVGDELDLGARGIDKLKEIKNKGKVVLFTTIAGLDLDCATKAKRQPLFTKEQEKEIIYFVKKYLNTIT